MMRVDGQYGRYLRGGHVLDRQKNAMGFAEAIAALAAAPPVQPAPLDGLREALEYVLQASLDGVSRRTWAPVAEAALAAPVPPGLDVELLEEVAAEGRRAVALHGEPTDRPGMHWLAILAEETGEVAMEVTKGEVPPINRDRLTYLTNLRGELVQVASVSMRWLAATDAALRAED
jgi:hypothetical protein